MFPFIRHFWLSPIFGSADAFMTRNRDSTVLMYVLAQVVSKEKRVAFMWELQPDNSPSTPVIHTEFSVQYRPLQLDTVPIQTYKCPFDIINYKVHSYLYIYVGWEQGQVFDSCKL